MAEEKSGEEKSLLEKFGFKEEIAEEVNIFPPGSKSPNDYIKTGYPEPLKRYKLIFESFNASIEETYFWILNHITQDQAYQEAIKIVDVFAASEQSSFWGYQQQRLGMQQDKAAQFMGTIAKMVKDMFQIVREVRVLKERLSHYREAEKGSEAADITLKGYFIDFVEGGIKGGTSVYSLAQNVGFATLPDIFFRIMIRKGESVDAVVEREAKEFNRKLREVLKRKLQQFVKWRDETYKELLAREKFTVKYLRQHWGTIKMYMTWVKPYIKNVKRLSPRQKYSERADLISAFEGSIMDIEFLAKRRPINNYYPVILASFEYRTRPSMSYQQEGFQKGPLHMGKVSVTLRAYAWSDEQIKNYIKYREEEDMDLIGYIDNSVKDALDAMGDEILRYLEEAEESVESIRKEKMEKEGKEKKKEKKRGFGILEPFTAIFRGAKELGLATIPEKGGKAKTLGNPKDAGKEATASMYQTYKNYKKSHGMLSW